MAITLRLNEFTEELKGVVMEQCCVKPKATQYNEDPASIVCFSTNTKTGVAYLPMGIWHSIYGTFPSRTLPRATMVSKKIMYTKATDPKGYRDQDVVVKEAMRKLERDHTVFIACSPGFGKTSVAAHLSCKLGLKTVVLCHIDKVNEQWVKEYTNFTTAKVQRVKGSTPLDPSADVYVIGVMKASKMTRDQFANIGIIIFDEAHIATITCFSNALLKFQPRYVIGLSATPKRSDGMHKLITMYFGPPKSFIVREERKDFEVFKVETPYKPKITYRLAGPRPTLDWSTLVNSLAYNTKRQSYIVGLVTSHPTHRIMILSDRQEECRSIYDKLIDAGETSTLLMTGETNTKNECTSDYRVLVAGMKKAGVGFDDPTLTMLILATDRKDVAQMEGRIRTVNNIIYDLVDDYVTLENHWEIREAWYLHRGAKIKTINQRGGTTQRLMR